MWVLLGKIANWIFCLSPYYKEYKGLKERDNSRTNELISVQRERDEYKAKLDIDNLEFKEGVLWDANNPENCGPFCQPCAHLGRGKVHLTGNEQRGWDCNVCHEFFSTETSRRLEDDIGRFQRF